MNVNMKLGSGERVLREASVLPATLNPTKRTVELVWSTGAQVRRFDILGEYLEELDMSAGAVDLSRLNNGAPLLDSHDNTTLAAVVGVVERAWLSGSDGRAVVRFAEGDERAEAIWRKVQQGVIRNVSVGYRVEAWKESRRDGKRVLRAVKWTPLELSAVAVPADAGAGFRSARAGGQTGGTLAARMAGRLDNVPAAPRTGTLAARMAERFATGGANVR